MSDEMTAEFDTLAAWTAEAVRSLGADHAIPAASRGSGSPAALAWLGEALELHAGQRVLDAGSGVGGPAAWFAQRYGVRPVCADPMPGAVHAGRGLFTLPSVVAGCEQLPFAAGAFDGAWALGLLSTSPRRPEMLTELRRVLRPGGALGLLVYAADRPPERPPAGNDFPLRDQLAGLLGAAGFAVVEQLTVGALPAAPRSWTSRVERVEQVVAAAHRHDERWQEAAAQSTRMGELVGDGTVQAVLLHARAR